jgi:sortase A
MQHRINGVKMSMELDDMKNHVLYFTAKILFLLSFFLFLYAGSQIFMNKSKVERTLEQWELSKTSAAIESPAAVININEQNTNENDDLIGKNILKINPKKGEVFGKIIIPKLNKEFPILQGTDEQELAKGVGHYIGSVLPGESDNTVLAGHRDTFFRKLGELGKGDHIIIETTGGTFTYEIYKQRIVDQNDRTVIVPYSEPVLSLVTCYPFEYIGLAPERFILIGKLINDIEEK